MNTKRIIPCLDIKDGKVVKGIHFKDILPIGNPVELARQYNEAGADELVLLDITASTDQHQPLFELIQQVAQVLDIPLIVGGGIGSLTCAQAILQAGATKVSIGSAAVEQPGLIQQLAKVLGKERIVVAIDTKKHGAVNKVCTQGGKHITAWETLAWAKEMEKQGAGEILLTSVDADGTQEGFALEITDRVSRNLDIPVIASGGAGGIEDFIQLFEKTGADAGLAASIFHYQSVNIPELKNRINAL